jgi:hypothetical protein
VIWIGLFLAGAALGVAFFGSLGLAVHVMSYHPRFAPLVGLTAVARFIVLGSVTMFLAHGTPAAATAILGGLLVGRWLCLRWVREHGLGV